MISRTVHARPNCETRLSRVIKEHGRFFFFFLSGITFFNSRTNVGYWLSILLARDYRVHGSANAVN